MSSIINSLAAITWGDYLQWKLDHLKEGTKTNILKIIGMIHEYVHNIVQVIWYLTPITFLDFQMVNIGKHMSESFIV